MAISEDVTEAEPSFVERVLRPVARGIFRLFRVVLPSSMIQRLQWRLTMAGDPIDIVGLAVVWAVCAIVLPLGYALLVTTRGGGFDQTQIVMFGVIALMGAYMPHVWLKLKISQRQTTILKTLPDAIDLLSTSVEAGLGVDAALGQVAEKVRGPLADEFRRVLREMAMGSARRDALKAFSERAGIADVKVFVNAMIQAEQMGVSLGQVIRVQADQMRLHRRQRAEEQAHKAPVKMSIPLVLFIFPTILLVILGPAVLQVIKSFGSE
jgi:tight adherence protein C